MIFTWVLYAVGFSLLLGLAGAAAELLLGDYRWSLRRLWSTCILVSWLSPLVLAVIPRSDRTQDGFSLTGSEPTVEIRTSTGLPRSRSGTATVPPRENRDPDLDSLFLTAWGLTTAFLLARQAFVLRRISRDQRGRPRSELDGIEVVRTDEYGPAVLGIFRPRILMPEWTERAAGSIRRLALLHEAEHVRCHDTHHLLAGWLPCAVFPWNLPLWWQLKRLRLAIEVDCDRRVLKRGASVAEYGDLLIMVGGRRTGNRALVALLESACEVERRLRLMTTRPPRGLAIRLAGLALIVFGGAALLASTPVPEPAVRVQFPQTQGASDSSSVRLIFPPSPGECVAGCSEENEATHLARQGLQPGACTTRVRIMIDRQGRPGDLSIVEEDPDSRCNDAALKWAEATRWDAPTGGPFGVVRPFGALNHGFDTLSPVLYQAAPYLDRRTPALLLTGDPEFDFESGIGLWVDLQGYQDWVVRERRNTTDPAVCVLGRGGDDRLVFTLLERDEAGDLLTDTMSEDAIEIRLRARAPGGEPYAAGVLSDGGACLVLTPNPEGLFRIFPLPGEGSARLLTHSDPEITLDLLLDAYDNVLSRQSLVADVRSRERMLCTVGRAPNGEVALRADLISANSALTDVTDDIGPNELARVAANLHPDLEWVAGDVLQEGGACLLTRPLPPE